MRGKPIRAADFAHPESVEITPKQALTAPFPDGSFPPARPFIPANQEQAQDSRPKCVGMHLDAVIGPLEIGISTKTLAPHRHLAEPRAQPT